MANIGPIKHPCPDDGYERQPGEDCPEGYKKYYVLGKYFCCPDKGGGLPTRNGDGDGNGDGVEECKQKCKDRFPPGAPGLANCLRNCDGGGTGQGPCEGEGHFQNRNHKLYFLSVLFDPWLP